MKTAFVFIAVAGLCAASATATASEFDFKWNDKNDMRGAYMMCSTTGFTQGDCPEVYQKCWQPPMVYRKKHKLKTYCTGTPNFTSTDSDRDRALDEGSKRAKEMYGE
ncbi:hypothetical protein N032_28040 (plasmid) [Pseudomonas syringae pv. pisi str. PP1]|uniref:hypothetical protein n=1 Tax=Pseudomonas syringae TaxID=317 RepID=UPI0004669803|nr:hypothetical protein [Pseudomonas syringae]AZG89404.1 hypothetical protein N032_28040 [Pseudomonas syringae pv. pisi str. PP1]